ncbi:MAG TPA: GNAT family N-acetyltransferase [Streptosporangiaceae bacterium]|jgi:predicted acetyltransferase
MPELVLPDGRVQLSFLTAMKEFQAEGRGGPSDDHSMLGREIQLWGDRWEDPAVFAEYTAWLRADAQEESSRPPGFVPATTLWWAEGDEYLGRISVRHRLTPSLLLVGGNIGYDVRPAARRRGHATLMLAAALPVARGLGIDRALLTCLSDNIGSRKVIEANGGVLEDERDGMLRFWVPCG